VDRSISISKSLPLWQQAIDSPLCKQDAPTSTLQPESPLLLPRTQQKLKFEKTIITFSSHWIAQRL